MPAKQKYGRRGSNPQPADPKSAVDSVQPPTNNGVTENGNSYPTKCTPNSVETGFISPDLIRIFKVWETLPAAVRVGIIAMVDSVEQEE